MFFSFSDAVAQDDTILYTPQQLRDDAGYYFSRLKWQHPDIYYYCDQKTFEQKELNILQQLNRPMTQEEFMMIMGTINSCLDDHSMIDVLIAPFFL